VNADGSDLRQCTCETPSWRTNPVDDVRGYHLRRARSERSLAYQSANDRVSDAHMSLSALHLQRLLRLDREVAERTPAWSSRLGTDGT
jgi:hypothetical protein